jgi:hypothetical protein
MGRYGSGTSFDGIIDDIRVYNKALTQEEVMQTMRGDPLLAWNPSPTNGSTPDIDKAVPLSWSPGDNASEHDVYFGTDEDAVEFGDILDKTGIYREWISPEVEWGSGPYFWRIDEYNTDGTISKGRVWNFTVGDFLSIDDFEGYNVTDKLIWAIWHDGFGYWDLDGVFHPGNNTGSGVGDEDNDNTYMEETIVRPGSSQSMPYFFNNNDPTKMKYSEAKKTLSDTRDWTKNGVKALSLWFQGIAASVGSFTDNFDGTYTMTASGEDIWAQADEFHFAYKPLSGAGSLIARVDSLDNTDAWAKAGVMIRDSLDPNAMYAFMCVSPTSGVAYQRRTDTAIDAVGDTIADISAPQWVKIERDVSGFFTASYSSDGSTWDIAGAAEQIFMGSNIFIGLAVTAHNASATCQAEFSNVQVSVSGPWANQDIGIESNEAERMYVSVANSNGTTGTVYYEDNDNIVEDATQLNTWTEFNIDLKDFQDQGVNLADVNSVTIGIGTRGSTTPGGEGKMYFEDIRLYQPRCISSLFKPDADLSGDCVVDLADIEILVSEWLKSGSGLAADLDADEDVDLSDFALMADAWLEELFWPQP